MSLPTRRRVLQLLTEGLKNMKRYMELRKMFEYSSENMLTHSAMQDAQHDPKFKGILVIQNSMKAYAYLITWYFSDFSKLKDSREVQKRQKKKDKEKD